MPWMHRKKPRLSAKYYFFLNQEKLQKTKKTKKKTFFSKTSWRYKKNLYLALAPCDFYVRAIGSALNPREEGSFVKTV